MLGITGLVLVDANTNAGIGNIAKQPTSIQSDGEMHIILSNESIELFHFVYFTYLYPTTRRLKYNHTLM